MDPQVFSEQDQAYDWLVHPPGANNQEDALDWLKSIGSGAAQGAATGAVAGPWGALVGGLVGAGLGAAQQALQQNTGSTRPASGATPQRPSSPPPRPPSPSQAVRQGTAPQTQSQPVTNPSGAAVQQLVQVLPQLLQLVQTIQPLLNSSRTPGRATEAEANGETGMRMYDTLAGDQVSDSAFGEAIADKTSQVLDETLPQPSLPTSLEKSALPLPAIMPSHFAIPFEWTDESVLGTPVESSQFQWTVR